MVKAKTVYENLLDVMEESRKLNESFVAMVKRMDSIRTHSADAAQKLAVEHGYGPEFMRGVDPNYELLRLSLIAACQNPWLTTMTDADSLSWVCKAKENKKIELYGSAIVTVQTLAGCFTAGAYRDGNKVAEASITGWLSSAVGVSLRISVPGGFDNLRVSCDTTLAVYKVDRVAL